MASVLLKDFPCNINGKVDNLHSTDDGESGEESHGASKRRQLVYKLNCFVLGDFVKRGRVKVDPHELQCCVVLYI